MNAPDPAVDAIAQARAKATRAGDAAAVLRRIAEQAKQGAAEADEDAADARAALARALATLARLVAKATHAGAAAEEAERGAAAARAALSRAIAEAADPGDLPLFPDAVKAAGGGRLPWSIALQFARPRGAGTDTPL